MGLTDGRAYLRMDKPLNRDERIQIEGLWRAGPPPSQIALIPGRHVRTMERKPEGAPLHSKGKRYLEVYPQTDRRLQKGLSRPLKN